MYHTSKHCSFLLVWEPSFARRFLFKLNPLNLNQAKNITMVSNQNLRQIGQDSRGLRAIIKHANRQKEITS